MRTLACVILVLAGVVVACFGWEGCLVGAGLILAAGRLR